MLTIIHGTDTAASRKYFFDQKEKIAGAIHLEGEKTTITDLAQIFEGGGLFMEEKVVFIENFFHKKKNKTEFAVLSEYVLKNAKTHNIFLWEGKELERNAFTLFKIAVPKVFKLPQTLFLFVDSLKPGNGPQLVTLFHQTIETTEPEMVFFMLVRQVRLLLAITSSRHSGELQRLQNQDSGQARMTEREIDELKRMQPWQKTKLQKQASLFTPEQLILFYEKLFEIEVAQKTGGLTTSLVTTIDFLLLEI